MKQLTKRKILIYLSIISLGTITTLSLVPSIFTQKNYNSSSLNVNTLQNVNINPRYDGITNIAPQINASIELINFFPNELITNQQSRTPLINLLIDSIVSPASNLTPQDIEILDNLSKVDNLKGTIEITFNINNYKAVINENGQLLPIKSKQFSVLVVNLKNALPALIPTQNQIFDVSDQFGSYTIIQANDILQTEILPSIVGGTQLDVFNINIRDKVFSFPNTISLKLNVNNYYDTNGEFITNNYNYIDIQLTGFKELLNSSVLASISGADLNLYANELTLDNTFELIKSNITNLSRELTKNDISNFSVLPNLVLSESEINFAINNNLWVDNAVIPTKNISLKIYDLKKYEYTIINNIITSGLSNLTTSMIKNSAVKGDWKKNTTLKSIIANEIVNPANSQQITPIDIEIVNVSEKGFISDGNYKELIVNFNVINKKATNEKGEVVDSLALSTTLSGFNNTLETTIDSQIIAKIPNSDFYLGYEVLSNVFANDVSEAQIRNIIANSFFSSSVSVTANDIKIVSSQPNSLDGTIDVEFDLINNKYIDGTGVSHPTKRFSIQIFGLKLFTQNTNINLVSNQIISANSFDTPLLEPALSLINRTDVLWAIVRSRISGPLPNNFSMSIENAIVDPNNSTSIKFDVVINNYYANNQLVKTPLAISAISLVDLPTNRPNVTYNFPVVRILNGSFNNASETIEAYRADGLGNNRYRKLQEKIAVNINNYLGSIDATKDIKIIGDPVFSSTENSILVTFQIINNKYNDGTGVGTNSGDLKIKFVGFSTISPVDKAAYNFVSLNNPEMRKVYASEFANELQAIQQNTSINNSDKLASLEVLLAKYVSINISNLNPDYTSFRFTANNSDIVNGQNVGSLTIDLYSSKYYDTHGNYQELDSLLISYKLSGFASVDGSNETLVLAKENSVDIFASEINLLNINDYVDIRNLPVNVQPNIVIEAIDVIEENGQLKDYGEARITIKVDSYFNNQGKLINSEQVFPVITIRTKAYLNTKLATTNLINKNNKEIIASAASDSVIKNIIFDNLEQKPSTNFNPNNDIIIINKKSNDEKGTLQVDFQLTKYYENGTLVQQNSETYSVIIEGFYPTVQNKNSTPFYKQIWFIVLVSVTGVGLLILLIVFLFYIFNRKDKEKDYWY